MDVKQPNLGNEPGYLVGGFIPLKNMKVSWDDYSLWKNNPNVPNHQPDIINRDSWQKILSGY